MPHPSRPLWQGRALALVGIVLLAFSLRSAVASLSPVLTRISAEMDVPASIAGLIGTAPPVCFALFGLLTPALERRFGLERLAAVALSIAAIGMVLRALAPNAPLLLAGTALIFAAVGVGNVLMPPLVKAYFPDRIGLMTALYSTVMSIATFLPPLIAVPTTDAAGWRTSLGMWSVFAMIAVVPWIVLGVRSRAAASAVDVDEPNPSVLGRMVRLPMAWALAVAFAASSATAYTSFMWLPKLLTETAGVSPAAAGALLSLFAAMGLPASLIVPFVVARFRRVGIVFVAAIACGLAGVSGLILLPATATWLWVVLLGLGPMLFPLVLVLVGVRTRTHEASVALSGFAQSVGYAIAAVIPFAVGLVHDATGGWTIPLAVLGVMFVAVIPAAVIASRPRTVEQEWERKHSDW